MVTRSSLPPLEEYVEMLKPIWDSAWLTNMGEYHETLKEKLKTYLKTPNLELFVNGHMALELTLQAMKLTGEVHDPVQLCLHHPCHRAQRPDSGILRYQ